MLWGLKPGAVPVNVSVEVPVGVPGVPAAQPMHSNRTSAAMAGNTHDTRRRLAASSPASIAAAASKASHGRIRRPEAGGGACGCGGTMDGAVVVTFTVTFWAFTPSSVTGEDAGVQVALLGAPLQASPTARLNPPSGVIVNV